MEQDTRPCARCKVAPRNSRSHKSYCVDCHRLNQAEARARAVASKGMRLCARCKVAPLDCSSVSYCRECHRALARESRARTGGKRPQTHCSRCGKIRDGRHYAYCIACHKLYRAERRTRPCARCGAERKPGGVGEGDVYCGDCSRAYHRERYRKYGPQISLICSMCGIERDPGDHKHTSYCPSCLYIWQLKYKYGITPEDYAAMLADQDGGCALCGITQSQIWQESWRHPLEIDHCHDTGRVRGLLCSSCNTSLGRFKHDPALLRKAADYLEAYASV